MTATGDAGTHPAVSAVLDLFAAHGDERYGEDVSQAVHAAQTAALAEAAGSSGALVAAALLHDVGHLLALAGIGPAPGPEAPHEATGADWLARWFPAEVTAPVRLHVEAKRYLCAVDLTYAAGLSAASTRSLAVQGGPLAEAEAAAFAGLPGAADAVALRRWDDAGKMPELRPAPPATYAGLLTALVGSKATERSA